MSTAVKRPAAAMSDASIDPRVYSQNYATANLPHPAKRPRTLPVQQPPQRILTPNDVILKLHAPQLLTQYKNKTRLYAVGFSTIGVNSLAGHTEEGRVYINFRKGKVYSPQPRPTPPQS